MSENGAHKVRECDQRYLETQRCEDCNVWCRRVDVGGLCPPAESRGSRLLPVQAEPGVRHPLLNSAQYVDMASDPAAARARVVEALLRVDAAGGRGWSDDRSPFPGLRPLDTDEHSVSFGRSQEVAELATLLRSPADRRA